MDDKLKQKLKTEMANMDTIVDSLKFHNKLNTTWRKMKSILMDHLKSEQMEPPSLFDKKLN